MFMFCWYCIILRDLVLNWISVGADEDNLLMLTLWEICCFQFYDTLVSLLALCMCCVWQRSYADVGQKFIFYYMCFMFVYDEQKWIKYIVQYNPLKTSILYECNFVEMFVIVYLLIGSSWFQHICAWSFIKFSLKGLTPVNNTIFV